MRRKILDWFSANWDKVIPLMFSSVAIAFFSWLGNLVLEQPVRDIGIVIVWVVIIVSVTAYCVVRALKEKAIPNISGKWFYMGDPAKLCEIRQFPGGLVDFKNENGGEATGLVNKSHVVAFGWIIATGKATIGTLSGSGNIQRIDWDYPKDKPSFWTKAGEWATLSS